MHLSRLSRVLACLIVVLLTAGVVLERCVPESRSAAVTATAAPVSLGKWVTAGQALHAWHLAQEAEAAQQAAAQRQQQLQAQQAALAAQQAAVAATRAAAPPTTAPRPAAARTSRSGVAAPASGDRFWRRLSNCESRYGADDGPYGGYFQMTASSWADGGGTGGWPHGSWAEQQAVAAAHAAHSNPWKQWPVCWGRALSNDPYYD